MSPDPYAIFGLQIQLGARLNHVGLVPSLDIAHRIASIFTRRMSVRSNLPSQPRVVLDLPPSLGERQKKALFAAQPPYYDIGLAFHRQDVSVMRCYQSR